MHGRLGIAVAPAENRVPHDKTLCCVLLAADIIIVHLKFITTRKISHETRN